MTEQEARNLIEEELKLKMLGPGYAKDLIVCDPDAHNEIIPESPRLAYSLGVLLPDNRNQNGNQGNGQNGNQDNEQGNNNDVNDDNQPDGDAIPNNVDMTNQEDRMSKLLGGSVENKSQDMGNNPMSSHIGLIICVSNDTNNVDVSISYGTYSHLNWNESVREVKVRTGHFSATISQAIKDIGNNNALQQQLNEEGLPEEFINCFNIDYENGTISLSKAMENHEPKNVLRIPNTEYPVEASMINILLGEHYKRYHHDYHRTLNFDNENGSEDLDVNMRMYWTTFTARDKKFVKILVKSISQNTLIYQPEIVVTPHNGKGRIESYVEPITNIDDRENNINEFIYRNVHNYGKGVNCAIGWDNDGQRVFTTFTPTVDVEKFSNEIAPEYNNDNIRSACTLRNVSIWSNLNDDEMIDYLRNFVEGYSTWQQAQVEAARNEEQYQDVTETILSRQEELLTRLRDNINYLTENNEALQCFKIANTAMLLQMVVARHLLFRKNRDADIYANEPDIYDSLDYFRNAEYTAQMPEPEYRPFQLAFLLMNVRSTFEINDRYHNDVVDLIWFPTGGGKTEAYLALTALTIVHRRRRGQGSGVSVIMRYTLRLLTSQQFERASYLICALNFLRQRDHNLGLGTQEISIGIYVGSGVTPNHVADLNNNPYLRFFAQPATRRNENPFPVSYCPWCGSRLVSPDGTIHGYDQGNGSLMCINQRCSYCEHLPIYYIDENIYNRRPTLLFATVDKFAQLNRPDAQHLLNPDNGIDAPDLIIQDELHLLVGALGSIVGLFESVVEALISRNGRRPKIIASTATTRNTNNLIKNLYHREVAVFPPQGLNYNDNYFSHIVPGATRRHIGMMPSGNSSSNIAEIRLTAFLLLSRIKVFKKEIEDRGFDWTNDDDVINVCNQDGELLQLLDNYWTTVLYFNSLKDLGRSRSRVSQEVFENFRAHKYLYQIPKSLSLLENRFDQRVLEFTSRIESNRIKGFLTEAESCVGLNVNDNGHLNVASGNDLVFASNMISVGIDISRWNQMVMVGQPRSTSEYVQSSSRVARNTYGLVINLLNPLRIREHSLFENYKSFHATYYKSVEPLSITPLTYSTIKHDILNNMIKIYKDYILQDPGLGGDALADAMIDDVFNNRFNMDNELRQSLSNIIANAAVGANCATSLRDIANDAFINIQQVNY